MAEDITESRPIYDSSARKVSLKEVLAKKHINVEALESRILHQKGVATNDEDVFEYAQEVLKETGDPTASVSINDEFDSEVTYENILKQTGRYPHVLSRMTNEDLLWELVEGYTDVKSGEIVDKGDHDDKFSFNLAVRIEPGASGGPELHKLSDNLRRLREHHGGRLAVYSESLADSPPEFATEMLMSLPRQITE